MALLLIVRGKGATSRFICFIYLIICLGGGWDRLGEVVAIESLPYGVMFSCVACSWIMDGMGYAVFDAGWGWGSWGLMMMMMAMMVDGGW